MNQNSQSPHRKSYSTTINPNLASPGYSYNPFNSFTTAKTFGNVFRLIPEGDDNHIRNAFYNVLAFLCLTIVLGISIAVYFVLEKFLRPIGWALLFGAFLHPFKRKLTKCLYDWIDSINVPETRKSSNNRTFLLSLFYSPVIFFAEFIQKIGDNIVSQWKYILSILGAISIFLVVHKLKIITGIIFLAKELTSLFVYSFDFWLTIFSGPWTIILILGYFTSIIFLDYDPVILQYSSYLVWLIIMCNISNYITNNYQTQSIIFLFLVLVYLAGLFYDLKVNKNKGVVVDSVEMIPDSGDDKEFKKNNKSIETLKEIKEIVVSESKNIQREAQLKKNEKPDVWDSNRYIMMLVWSCLFIEFYKWVFLLAPLAVLIALVKRIGSHFGIWELIYNNIYNSAQKCAPIRTNIQKFRLVLINTPIKGVYQMFLTVDRLLITSIRNSIDHATTVLLLIFTLMTLATLGVFLSFQIYQESAHIVNIAHSALNSTISENQWFQSSGMEKSMDTVFEKGYQTGREWIASQFDDFNKHNNKDLSKLETQVLNLWDNVYENMIKKGGPLPFTFEDGENISTSSGNALSISKRNVLLRNWQNVIESVTQVGTAHREGIVKFIKENIDTFNSVLSTVWVIVKSNLNIIFIVLSNVWGVIFGGGTAILNFFLSWVIFLSTIVYFLSSSGEQYKPFQWFTQFMPTNNDDENNNPDNNSQKNNGNEIKKTGSGASVKTMVVPRIDLSNPQSYHPKETLNEDSSQNNPMPEYPTGGANKIALAIQEAISGVFAATLKMASFYGLYTWLTHKIFGVGMVYIPTALAAIFAAVPFVGTYVAALPATLELWILTGSYVIPLIFLGLHFLPKFFVDATIYQEIKGGGHPYFTGLSIVGGIYMFGLEGALIGPLLLCCLLAGLKVFGAYMHEE